MASLSDALQREVDALPATYPGPGGAIAVIHRSEVLVRGAWGWANPDFRIPFTPSTPFRLCSITKQFTCALALSLFADPTVLDVDIRGHLPRLQGPVPGFFHLCHNQSGLRDYSALAMLAGSGPEDMFSDADAHRFIEGTTSLQFEPGSRFSYSNGNFSLLGWMLEERTGRSFDELLREQIFDRVGMSNAFVAQDTRALPSGVDGYEGSESDGFRLARNRIMVGGDGALVATLDDMIAWERYIDSTRDDGASIYAKLSAPVRFSDGAAAFYGFGLSRRVVGTRQVLGHGGALRGWRCCRLYVPSERLSVVIFFNHMADAQAVAHRIVRAAFGEEVEVHSTIGRSRWLGAYLEPETRLAVHARLLGEGGVALGYNSPPERLRLDENGTGVGEGVRISVVDDGVQMQRERENQISVLAAIGEPSSISPLGRYRCDELQAEFEVVDVGGAFYGAVSGSQGRGRMELLSHAGANVWMYPCPRALDYSPPGDWTLIFEGESGSAADTVEIGCWLARRLVYRRLPA